MNIVQKTSTDISVYVTRDESSLIRRLLSNTSEQLASLSDDETKNLSKVAVREVLKKFKGLFQPISVIGAERALSKGLTRKVPISYNSQEVKEVTLTPSSLIIISESAKLVLENEVIASYWDSMIAYPRQTIKDMIIVIEGALDS